MQRTEKVVSLALVLAVAFVFSMVPAEAKMIPKGSDNIAVI